LHARAFCNLLQGTSFIRQNRPDEPEKRKEDADDPQQDVSLPEREQTHSEETDNVNDDQERGEKPIEYGHVIDSFFSLYERYAEPGVSSKLSSI
jgi:hypothetical protein